MIDLQLVEEIVACRRCPLNKDCCSPLPGKMRPEAQLLVVVDQPDRDDDQVGAPLESRRGLHLRALLRRAGFEQGEVSASYLVKCYSSKELSDTHVDACKGWLWREMQGLPGGSVVLSLGKLPTITLLRLKKSAALKDYVGKFHELDYLSGVRVAPWDSPTSLLNQGRAADRETIEFFTRVREMIRNVPAAA